MPVTFAEAALGAEIKVPTLGGGPVTLKIPAGTPNGRTFRVRGKGVAQQDGTKGDLLVTVEVAVPGELDAEARAALEAYRRRRPAGDDPRARPAHRAHGRRGTRRAQWPSSAIPELSTEPTTPPVFVISVAAELTGLHAQTLRTYDRLGLVSPGRTGGGGRRYSARDIDAAARGLRLSASGIGLEGVRRILELENRLVALRAQRGAARRARGHREALRQAVSGRRSSRRHPAARRAPAAEQPSVVVWRRGR